MKANLNILWLFWFFSLFFMGVARADALPNSTFLISPVVGQFVFKQNFNVDIKIHDEIFYVANEAGQKKMDELLSQEYQCQMVINNQAICSKIVEPEQNQQFLLTKLSSIYGEKWVQIHTASSPPKLEIESEVYEQWRVEQMLTSNFLKNDYSFARYDFLKKTNQVKIYPGGYQSGGVEKIFVVEGEFLSLPHEIHIQKNRFQRDRYLISVKFER